ncbi:MAG: hypothetical protein NZ530_06890 [Thermodesulfobacteriaceae bacterium]|nr:hypothetical protein [Thermodesulfobacteriaceae bacterium]MCX8041981.1 hypothetical protein [Thermodesulfobacteriaceae bacterium]
MLFSLAKVEFKKTFTFYILLFLFFIFWNFFSLLSFFLFKNLENFLKVYQEKLSINIFISSEPSNKTISSLISEIQTLPFVKKVEVVPPLKLLENWKKDLPPEVFSLFREEEILKNFPYLIRIYLSSPEHFLYFQEQFVLVSKVFKDITYENSKFNNILNFLFFFKKIFWGLALTWFIFYLVFLLLLNFFINSLMNKNIKIFILLGGSFIRLSLIRIILFIITMGLSFIISWFIYSYFIENLLLIFSFLKVYPNIKDVHHLLYFLIYLFFIIILFPTLIILFLNFWMNEN